MAYKLALHQPFLNMVLTRTGYGFISVKTRSFKGQRHEKRRKTIETP